MGKYTRKGKQSSKTPDEFVGFWQRLFEAAAPYSQPIGFTLLGALVVLVGAWIASELMVGAREQATAEFAHAARIDETELLGDEPPQKKDTTDSTPRFKTGKERTDAVIAELDKLDKEHGGTQVAKRAALLRASEQYDQGKFADAQATYQKVLDQLGEDDSLRFLVREAIGLCAENQNRLDEALTAYKAIEPKAGDFYRDRALYDQARVLVKKGDKKGAETLYRAIIAMPDTKLRDEAQNQLGLLGLSAAAPQAGG